MKHTILIYFITLIIMMAMDMAWIGGIARSFYKARIDNLEFHMLPAILFYVLYGIGVVVFVNGGADANTQSTLLYGALFGLFAYSTYDLTNLATLKGWSVTLSIVDVAWGTFVTAAASTCGLLLTRYLER